MTEDKHPNHGTSLEDFLQEDDNLEAATAIAVERVNAISGCQMTDGYENINVGEIWYIRGILNDGKWTLASIELGRYGGHNEGRRVIKFFGVDYGFKLRETPIERFIGRVNGPYVRVPALRQWRVMRDGVEYIPWTSGWPSGWQEMAEANPDSFKIEWRNLYTE